MSDITTPDTRTRRLSFLDAFMPIGFIIGLPIGTWLRNRPEAILEEAFFDYLTLHIHIQKLLLQLHLFIYD